MISALFKGSFINMALILGIETSCDETAAAVFCTKTGKMLSNCLFSQISIHQRFGGVMPEIASRSHVEKIDLIVAQALEQAKVTLQDLDLIAVTNNPGLVGSLLIGVCFAKGLAWACDKKIVGINHNHGHILSALLDKDGKLIPDFPFPHLCISLSGGHTSIFLVKSKNDYELVGQTIDDAAGEAMDKISKLLGLGYPGGPIIEKLAQEVGFQDFFSYPRGKDRKSLNFSFSGLKTAILYHLVKLGIYDLKTGLNQAAATLEIKQKVASSLLVCVKDIILGKIDLALKLFPQIKAVSMVGGVACNKFLTNELGLFCQSKGVKFYSPSRQFCTDNGAMIALAGAQKLAEEKFDDFRLDVLGR